MGAWVLINDRWYKVRESGGGVHPAMTEQPADDWQTLAEGERARSMGVPKVVKAHILDAICPTHPIPCALQPVFLSPVGHDLLSP